MKEGLVYEMPNPPRLRGGQTPRELRLQLERCKAYYIRLSSRPTTPGLVAQIKARMDELTEKLAKAEENEKRKKERSGPDKRASDNGGEESGGGAGAGGDKPVRGFNPVGRIRVERF
jgi:hypothetical protein